MPAPIKSPEIIREAVAQYMDCGNLAAVARIHNVDRSTVYYWRESPEWQAVQAEYEAEVDTKLKARLRKNSVRALDRVMERLDGGDVRVTKDGQCITAPVNARDSALIAALMIDKLRLLEGKPGKLIATATVKDLARAYERQGQEVARTVIHSPIEGQAIDITGQVDDKPI